MEDVLKFSIASIYHLETNLSIMGSDSIDKKIYLEKSKEQLVETYDAFIDKHQTEALASPLIEDYHKFRKDTEATRAEYKKNLEEADRWKKGLNI